MPIRSLDFSVQEYGGVLILGAPYAYVYWKDGVLIDTGTGYWGRRIRAYLEAEGLAVRRVLFTHSHYDHVGGYTYLRDLPSEGTAAHPHFYEVMRRERVVKFIEEMNRRELSLLGEDEDYTFYPPLEGESLGDGQTVELSNGSVEVVYTPGHTRDSVSYYVLPERLMVVGEAAGVPNGEGTYIHPQFLSSVVDYLNSLRRLRDYDIHVLGLPHERVIFGRKAVRDYLRLSEAATKKYVSVLQGIYEECGGDWECIRERARVEIKEKNALKQPDYAFFANLKAQIKALEKEFYSP